MQGKCDASFVNKLHQEVKVLNNIGFILEKINSEGFLAQIHNSISNLIDNELKFAMRELLNLDSKIGHLEAKNQLINNTYIFKENLKCISTYLSWFNS